MTEMAAIVCGECGIEFHVPVAWQKARKDDHVGFYCPNGHCRVYKGESEKEKLRRELDVATQQIARAEDEKREAERRAVAAERRERLLKKRASAGTCPCCQRTFSNMNTHMRKKHPEFVQQAGKIVPLKKNA